MQAFWNSIVSVFSTMGIVDYLDILIMTFVVYELIMLARKTRAAQLVKGIVILLLAYLLASQLGFKTLNFVLDKVVQFGIIAVIVVFQPELRRALEQLGRSKISRFSPIRLIFGSKKLSEADMGRLVSAINDICDAAERMAQDKTGALIAIELETGLGDIITTGTVVDSAVSTELITTVFYEGSPLHDGAVVIRDGRLYAAGCYLPLSQNSEIGREMGTRHRAALGLSENSDAIIIIVSEETGIISVAQNGVMVRRLDRQGLLRILKKEILPSEEDTKSLFGKVFKNEK